MTVGDGGLSKQCAGSRKKPQNRLLWLIRFSRLSRINRRNYVTRLGKMRPGFLAYGRSYRGRCLKSGSGKASVSTPWIRSPGTKAGAATLPTRSSRHSSHDEGTKQTTDS